MFVPIASILTNAHRDSQFLASFAQLPEIQHLVSQGQIVFGELPLQTDRLTDRWTTITGASLSEPHINGTSLCELYVWYVVRPSTKLYVTL